MQKCHGVVVDQVELALDDRTGAGRLVFPGRDHPPRVGAEVTVEQDSTLRILEGYRAASKNTLADRMGIAIVEASAEGVVGTTPVAGNTQPYGLLHGGASCVLAETDRVPGRDAVAEPSATLS